MASGGPTLSKKQQEAEVKLAKNLGLSTDNPFMKTLLSAPAERKDRLDKLHEQFLANPAGTYIMGQYSVEDKKTFFKTRYEQLAKHQAQDVVQKALGRIIELKEAPKKGANGNLFNDDFLEKHYAQLVQSFSTEMTVNDKNLPILYRALAKIFNDNPEYLEFYRNQFQQSADIHTQLVGVYRNLADFTHTHEDKEVAKKHEIDIQQAVDENAKFESSLDRVLRRAPEGFHDILVQMRKEELKLRADPNSIKDPMVRERVEQRIAAVDSLSQEKLNKVVHAEAGKAIEQNNAFASTLEIAFGGNGPKIDTTNPGHVEIAVENFQDELVALLQKANIDFDMQTNEITDAVTIKISKAELAAKFGKDHGPLLNACLEMAIQKASPNSATFENLNLVKALHALKGPLNAVCNDPARNQGGELNSVVKTLTKQINALDPNENNLEKHIEIQKTMMKLMAFKDAFPELLPALDSVVSLNDKMMTRQRAELFDKVPPTDSEVKTNNDIRVLRQQLTSFQNTHEQLLEPGLKEALHKFFIATDNFDPNKNNNERYSLIAKSLGAVIKFSEVSKRLESTNLTDDGPKFGIFINDVHLKIADLQKHQLIGLKEITKSKGEHAEPAAAGFSKPTTEQTGARRSVSFGLHNFRERADTLSQQAGLQSEDANVKVDPRSKNRK